MVRTGVPGDEMWSRVEPVLLSPGGRQGWPSRDHRQVVEDLVCRLRTGVPWRDLPQQSGPWQTVWKRHARFSRDGTWDALLTRLLADADAVGELDWAVSVDSTVVRAHQHSATAKRTVAEPDLEAAAKHTEHAGGAVELQGCA